MHTNPQPQADNPLPATKPLDDESRIVQAMFRRLTQLAADSSGPQAQRYATAAAKFTPQPQTDKLNPTP